MRRTAPFTITLTANACIRRQGMDCGNSLLNPFMRLPAPLLRHENPSRLPLQHLQPIRIADRPADGFDPPQGRIGSLIIKGFTQELGKITHTIRHRRHLYNADGVKIR